MFFECLVNKEEARWSSFLRANGGSEKESWRIQSLLLTSRKGHFLGVIQWNLDLTRGSWYRGTTVYKHVDGTVNTTISGIFVFTHTRLARNTAEHVHHSPTNTVTFLSIFFGCRRSLRCKAPCKRMQHCCSSIPNIFGCYMFASVSHPVACCCVLLGVVAQSLKPIKLLSQQLPTFRLFRDRWSVAQQCWIRLHSSSNIVGATHAHYTWSPESYGLYPSHDALKEPTLPGVVNNNNNNKLYLYSVCIINCSLTALLHPFTHHCQHRRNNSQHC